MKNVPSDSDCLDFPRLLGKNRPWHWLFPSFLGIWVLSTPTIAALAISLPNATGTDSGTPLLAQSTPAAPTLVEEIQVRNDGIVVNTSGKLPEYRVNRSQDGTWMSIDILGAALSSTATRSNQRVNQDGVSLTQVTQLATSPPVVRLTVSTPNPSQRWEGRAFSRGVIVWPQGAAPPTIAKSDVIATVESVELQNNTEFVIKADQPLLYTAGWDQETGAYSLTLFSAKLPPEVTLPTRTVGGPFIWVRRRQEDAETVTLLIKPATGVKMGQTYQSIATQVTLPMGWGTVGVAPPPVNRPPSTLPPLLPRPSTRPPVQFPLPPGNNQPVPQNPRPRTGQWVIAIDPGHGGPVDRGAVGNGLEEKDVVLDISLQVAQILRQSGIQIVMTRTDDRDLDLPPRTEIANRVNADLFVSIHANAISLSRPDVNGLETYYYDSGQVLAQYIHNSMLETFPNLQNRGVKQARFYVLRNTSMPSVLVEVGFITGDYDSRVLADPAQRSRMAQAISRGILRYIQGGR